MSWRLKISDLASACGGETLRSGVQAEVSGVGTDTRASLAGQAFFALKGETYDANLFLAQAAANGAACVVTHDRAAAEALAKNGDCAVVLVADTLRALQDLGQWWRRRMPARILAVTGTNGKTTAKEFAAAIISTRKKTQWSRGSFNNHWGVPITLLSIDPSHEVAMVEMGMNHPGELTELMRIAEPDAVGCTMVGRGHLEGMGSIEGVARGKAEIYERARAGATMIFNADDPFVARMRDEALARGHDKQKMLCFGRAQSVASADGASGAGVALDVCLRVEAADDQSITVSGHVAGEAGRARVPAFGAHNVVNLMAASCFALAAGLSPADIWSALPSCRGTWGRNQWVDLGSGARALFDAYNANPESMGAAISNFSHLSASGRKFAVLGEMREMGEAAPRVHQEIGLAAAGAGFHAILFVGDSKDDFAAGLKRGGFSKKLLMSSAYEMALARELASMLSVGDIVLFKGSRGVRLEKALNDFEPLNFAAKG